MEETHGLLLREFLYMNSGKSIKYNSRVMMLLKMNSMIGVLLVYLR